MFDIGFWELVIISIVALLIVGPERLPGLVRDVGRWSRAVRRFVAQTRQDLERELDFEEDFREEKDLASSLRNMDELMDIAPDRDQRQAGETSGRDTSRRNNP
jgi:sec-independent protein translocase protein TatB